MYGESWGGGGGGGEEAKEEKGGPTRQRVVDPVCERAVHNHIWRDMRLMAKGDGHDCIPAFLHSCILQLGVVGRPAGGAGSCVELHALVWGGSCQLLGVP